MVESKSPKDAELRKRGAMHPHPERVADPLFAEHEFLDARDLLQVKYEMLRHVRVDGHPVAQAARDAGLSRQTFYQTQTAYERAGLHGLLPDKPGPRSAHKLSPAVMAYVEMLLKEQEDLSSSDLVERILERFDMTVHPRSIERALTRREKKGS